MIVGRLDTHHKYALHRLLTLCNYIVCIVYVDLIQRNFGRPVEFRKEIYAEVERLAYY